MAKQDFAHTESTAYVGMFADSDAFQRHLRRWFAAKVVKLVLVQTSAGWPVLNDVAICSYSIPMEAKLASTVFGPSGQFADLELSPSGFRCKFNSADRHGRRIN